MHCYHFRAHAGYSCLADRRRDGYKKFAAEITTVGSCSAAISAACHASGTDSEELTGKKIRWGDVGTVSNLGVRHLTFSSEEGVRKPIFGEAYAGSVREEE